MHKESDMELFFFGVGWRNRDLACMPLVQHSTQHAVIYVENLQFSAIGCVSFSLHLNNQAAAS